MANQETGLIVQQSRELLPPGDVLNSMYEVAKRIVNTPLVPADVKTPESCFAIMLKGRELGMPMMASLAGLYVIKGKVSLYADAMLGLVYRDHGDSAVMITETTPDQCTIVYKRQSWKTTQTHTFTMAMANLAGLPKGNPNWGIRPANMLRARCISEVCRMAFADSIQGLYTVEEMQDASIEEPRNVTPAPTHTVNRETGEVLSAAPEPLGTDPITPDLAQKVHSWALRLRKKYGADAGELPTPEDIRTYTVDEAHAALATLLDLGTTLKAAADAAVAATEPELVEV